jgi:hypothetical protein
LWQKIGKFVKISYAPNRLALEKKMLNPIFAQNEVEVKNEIESNDDRLFRPRYKISIHEQISVYKELQADGQETSAYLHLRYELSISISQINRIRQEWGLEGKSGRPRRKKGTKPAGQITKLLPQAGVSLFARWLEETGRLVPVFARLHEIIEQYRAEHWQEEFRLLHAGLETIELKWEALLLLPLLGIKKLSEIDYMAPNLPTVLGYRYGSSTLTQYLGELEKVGAAEIKTELAVEARGQFCYIDGHMVPFWTRVKMHKGKITMMGRIMAGTKAVVAHDGNGQAINFECYPPDSHLNRVIEKQCTAIETDMGITRFIIDREVNAVEIARRFVKRGWGLICLLDANEYDGDESFRRHPAGQLEDGSKVYWATWKPERPDDPRQFVLVQEEQRLLAYWCTPKLARELSAAEVVTLYRLRVDIQENGFKHLIARCAFNTNFGTKKIWGPDRMQAHELDELQTKQTKLQVKEQKVGQEIAAQRDKIQDSEAKGHDELLVKRKAKLAQYETKQAEIACKLTEVEAQKHKLGEPKKRADRDLRKQTIMMFRSLWLENAIRAFFALISGFLTAPLDLEIGIELFFFRPASLVETDSRLLYLLDDKNLSPKYQEVLRQLVAGFNSISLSQRGKRLQVEITTSP